MKKIFLFLILVQITIIVYLTNLIYQKNLNILGQTDLNPIDKNSLVFTSSADLKYFYEPKPNSVEKVNEWSPYKGIYTINSDSLNERFDYSIKKPEKTYRIITLGDSFTYGLYIDTKDNWPERLEDMLNNKLRCLNFDKFEVINLAIQGYDFQYNVKRFKLRGTKYKPDLVIWFIVDDLRITDKINSLSSEIKDQLRKNGDSTKINSYYSWIMARQQIIDTYGSKEILDFQINNLKKFIEIYQGPIFFIYNEFINKSHRELFENYLMKHYNNYFSSVISIPQESRFLTDQHPNQLGHQKIAEDVFDYLMKNKIIPCD